MFSNNLYSCLIVIKSDHRLVDLIQQKKTLSWFQKRSLSDFIFAITAIVPVKTKHPLGNTTMEERNMSEMLVTLGGRK